VADLADARFHLIGHLPIQQGQEGRRAVPGHPDSGFPQAGPATERCRRALDVMLEVKLSEEEAKSGADPAALAELIEAVRACGNLRLLA